MVQACRCAHAVEDGLGTVKEGEHSVHHEPVVCARIELIGFDKVGRVKFIVAYVRAIESYLPEHAVARHLLCLAVVAAVTIGWLERHVKIIIVLFFFVAEAGDRLAARFLILLCHDFFVRFQRSFLILLLLHVDPLLNTLILSYVVI